MPSTVIGTIWVCDCCLFAREGDGDGCDGNGGCAGEPWKLIGDHESVTLGKTYEEHSCGIESGERMSAAECDCECREFSWSSCDGCGSPLGGRRHAYTLWDDAR